MKMTPEGFLRPEVGTALTNDEDRLVSDICPGITLVQKPEMGDDHPLWGPIVAVYTGAATDAKLRHHGSSGGVLSAILLYLIESKAVDYVVQNVGSEQLPLENTIIESKNRNDVIRAAGSRYAPSAPLSQLDRQLKRPGRFAFVGKPCDVAALRALELHDPRVSNKVPYILSFFCAGIPSMEGTREILRKLNVEEKDVVAFRYRGDGWPGTARARLRDGREEEMSYADSWGGILSHHVQFRCKICPDGTGGFADLVCADAWHCDEQGYPLFEEEEARSLILTRTPKGEDLLQKAVDAGYLTVEELSTEEIAPMQPGQVGRKQLVFSRLCAMALMGRRIPKFQGLQLLAAAIKATPWQNIRNFLGMARRLLIGKA